MTKKSKSSSTDKKPTKPFVECTACKKTNNDVRFLIGLVDKIYICNECVELCSEIIEEKTRDPIVLWCRQVSDDMASGSMQWVVSETEPANHGKWKKFIELKNILKTK